MKQYNLFGGLDTINPEIQELEEKTNYNSNRGTVDRYFGSDLNKFVAINCRKDMVVNKIDLIINDYKKNDIKIIQSKHKNEKLTKGQEILLKRIAQLGIKTYVIYGDEPYDEVDVYSFQKNVGIKMNKHELIRFLNNEI